MNLKKRLGLIGYLAVILIAIFVERFYKISLIGLDILIFFGVLRISYLTYRIHMCDHGFFNRMFFDYFKQRNVEFCNGTEIVDAFSGSCHVKQDELINMLPKEKVEVNIHDKVMLDSICEKSRLTAELIFLLWVLAVMTFVIIFTFIPAIRVALDYIIGIFDE